MRDLTIVAELSPAIQHPPARCAQNTSARNLLLLQRGEKSYDARDVDLSPTNT
jgi:hypothetical protein